MSAHEINCDKENATCILTRVGDSTATTDTLLVIKTSMNSLSGGPFQPAEATSMLAKRVELRLPPPLPSQLPTLPLGDLAAAPFYPTNLLPSSLFPTFSFRRGQIHHRWTSGAVVDGIALCDA